MSSAQPAALFLRYSELGTPELSKSEVIVYQAFQHAASLEGLPAGSRAGLKPFPVVQVSGARAFTESSSRPVVAVALVTSASTIAAADVQALAQSLPDDTVVIQALPQFVEAWPQSAEAKAVPAPAPAAEQPQQQSEAAPAAATEPAKADEPAASSTEKPAESTTTQSDAQPAAAAEPAKAPEQQPSEKPADDGAAATKPEEKAAPAATEEQKPADQPAAEQKPAAEAEPAKAAAEEPPANKPEPVPEVPQSRRAARLVFIDRQFSHGFVGAADNAAALDSKENPLRLATAADVRGRVLLDAAQKGLSPLYESLRKWAKDFRHFDACVVIIDGTIEAPSQRFTPSGYSLSFTKARFELADASANVSGRLSAAFLQRVQLAATRQQLWSVGV